MKFKKIFEVVDVYDSKFGVPTSEVISFNGVLEFLDDVIYFSNHSLSEDNKDNLNIKYNLLVDRVMMTKLFEEAVKGLAKKHRTDVLLELKDAIIKLGKYEISSNKKNHPLTNLQGHLDLHLDKGNLILLYKYESANILLLAVSNDSLNQILKL